MASLTGVPANGPNKYLGPTVAYPVVVTRNTTPGVGYFGCQDNSGTPSKGAGGLASAHSQSLSAATGNAGADGLVIITEYCN